MTVRTVPDLARLDYFQGMDARVLSSVSEHARVQTLAAGEVLFRQGDKENTSAYLLLTGTISVHCKSEAQMSASNNTLQPAHPAQDAGESSRGGEHVSHSRSACQERSGEGEPAQRKPPLPPASFASARLGGTKTYVGLFVQKRFMPVHEPEDHGDVLYRRLAGGMIGCLAALTGCARLETAVAETRCTLLEIRSDDYKAWLATTDEKRYAADCLFLRNTTCFRRLSDHLLVKPAASFHRMSHPSKVDVCRQGTTAVAMHLIRTGECELVRRVKLPTPELGRAAERSNINLYVADLRRNDLFGHYELLSEKTHCFSVTTKTDVEVWSLTSEDLEVLNDLFAKEHGAERKRLTNDLLEHGKASDSFHRQRASDIGAARWDQREQAKATEYAIKQERETPQWKADEAAAIKAANDKEQYAGNFTSALEAGPGLVGKVLGSKVYTRIVELQPRIHPLLLIPLGETERRLPQVLSKRKERFAEKVNVELAPPGLTGARWESAMEFEAPFVGAVQKYSQRELEIHDQLHFAVNMFTAYAALAMDRIEGQSPSPQRGTVKASHQLQPEKYSNAQDIATRKLKFKRSHGEWIDLQAFLSLLEGANLILRDERHMQEECSAESAPIDLSILVKGLADLDAQNLRTKPQHADTSIERASSLKVRNSNSRF